MRSIDRDRLRAFAELALVIAGSFLAVRVVFAVLEGARAAS
jgi:hypothetical protein